MICVKNVFEIKARQMVQEAMLQRQKLEKISEKMGQIFALLTILSDRKVSVKNKRAGESIIDFI